MQDLQKKVQEFCNTHNLNTTPESRLIDVVSELGEVAKEILVASNYGKNPLEKNEKIEMEIGDVVFSVIALSNALGIDTEEALEKVIIKYTERAKKGSIGSEVE